MEPRAQLFVSFLPHLHPAPGIADSHVKVTEVRGPQLKARWAKEEKDMVREDDGDSEQGLQLSLHQLKPKGQLEGQSNLSPVCLRHIVHLQVQFIRVQPAPMPPKLQENLISFPLHYLTFPSPGSLQMQCLLPPCD